MPKEQNKVLPESLEVAVRTRSELDSALDAAVRILQPAARQKKVGVAVTRVAPGQYVVALSAEVPYGLTCERWHELAGSPPTIPPAAPAADSNRTDRQDYSIRHSSAVPSGDVVRSTQLT
jgi:hypothetical protein